MSKLSNLPNLPTSVGGQPIPDFMKFEIVGDGKLPVRQAVPAEFDFLIKKSPVFGIDSGKKFDQGAVWYPLREVKFALSNTGLGHYQGHYPGRSTRPVGQLPSTDSISLKLNQEEHIVGFRAYSSNNVIEGVRVWTNGGSHKDFGKVQGPTGHGQDPEAFFVPEHHEVVNFFGHTNDDGQIHGLGVSYIRRLSSVAAKAPASTSSGPPPTLNAMLSQTYLDASTQQTWSDSGTAAIRSKQERAHKDLLPLYEKINNEGDDAWTIVRDPTSGQEYYTCYNSNAIVWSYVNDQPSKSGDDDIKTSIISIGSFSKTQNILGVSGYIWDSIPATTTASIIGLAVTFFIQPLIAEGIAWGIGYAAAMLGMSLYTAGAETLAGLVAASVAATGGLVIAGVIGIFVAYGIMALFGFLWKNFWLIVNIYNFDAEHEWRTVSHYNDNALISNGSWQNYTIPTFKPANSMVFPPGFEPQEPLESVVTYLSITWENDNTFMEGLGEGIVLHRADAGMGLALKYVVHHAWDNEMGLELFEGNLASFDLGDWYDNGHWAMAKSRYVSSSGVEASGSTPKLSGSENDDYYYDVCIQFPSSVSR